MRPQVAARHTHLNLIAAHHTHAATRHSKAAAQHRTKLESVAEEARVAAQTAANSGVVMDMVALLMSSWADGAAATQARAEATVADLKFAASQRRSQGVHAVSPMSPRTMMTAAAPRGEDSSAAARPRALTIGSQAVLRQVQGVKHLRTCLAGGCRRLVGAHTIRLYVPACATVVGCGRMPCVVFCFVLFSLFCFSCVTLTAMVLPRVPCAFFLCRYLNEPSGRELTAPIRPTLGDDEATPASEVEVLRVSRGVGNVGTAAATARVVHATETVRQGEHVQVHDIACAPLRDRRSGAVIGVLESVFNRDSETAAGLSEETIARRVASRNEGWLGAFVPFLELLLERCSEEVSLAEEWKAAEGRRVELESTIEELQVCVALACCV